MAAGHGGVVRDSGCGKLTTTSRCFGMCTRYGYLVQLGCGIDRLSRLYFPLPLSLPLHLPLNLTVAGETHS